MSCFLSTERSRESRKPASALPKAVTAPSSFSNDDDDDDDVTNTTMAGTENGSPLDKTMRGADAGRMFSSFSPASVSTTRLSRSYVSLLAAAATDDDSSRGRRQVRGVPLPDETHKRPSEQPCT